MRKEIERILNDIYYDGYYHKVLPGARPTALPVSRLDTVIALVAQKVRALEIQQVKNILPEDYDSTTAALCDGFEYCREAILKELMSGCQRCGRNYLQSPAV